MAGQAQWLKMPNRRLPNSGQQQRSGNWNRARIITHGFVGGGYKDSSPWRNVNRTQHSNDSTNNLGDKMGWNGSYIDGGHSDTYFYTFGLDNGYAGNNNDAWRMQMSNESGSNMQDTMQADKGDLGVFMDHHHQGQNIYTMGGGTNHVDRFNMNNHSRSNAATTNSGGYVSSAQGRLRGWTSIDNARTYYTFANNSWSTWSNGPGTDGWGKANSSYMGWFYMKNGGNCTTSIWKINDYTGTQLTSWNVENSGEENYQMGSFKGYCLGHYNGAQNNNSYKMSYTSDTWSQGGNNMEPGGHAGMSSAGCGSAANFVNTSYGITPPSY